MNRVRTVNTLRAAMYFSVVGIQWIHCGFDGVTCGAMILLVPFILGVFDLHLFWKSGSFTYWVRYESILLSIISITVAVDTLVSITFPTTSLTDYLLIMIVLSVVVMLLSWIEFITMVFNPQDSKEVKLPGSERTYDRWNTS